MAQSLETLKNRIKTSLFGRRLGLDNDDYLVGPPDIKREVTDLTSGSTATAIPARGIVNVTGSSLATSGAGGTFLLSNPVPGVEVTICNLNADTSAASPGSTAMTFIRPSTAFLIRSSEGTTETTINLAVGAAVTLVGLSTGYYQVKNRTTLAGVIINGTT
jgi:hypothetical protein